MRRFDGKAVLILGGNAGIGAAAALLFGDEGARLVITGRNEATLGDIAAQTGAHSIRADMGMLTESCDSITAAADHLGGIDVLFVNAGVGGFAMVPDVTEDFWDGIHDVNVKGAFFAMQAAIPHMKEGGSIVVTGSIGSVAAVPGNVAYAAAKAGLRAVARIVGKELLPRGIRVNMVSPGPTDTEIFKRDASPEEIQGMRDMLSGVVPLGRKGTSEEIARAALFLASDEASFINGVDLYVDGGCVEL